LHYKFDALSIYKHIGIDYIGYATGQTDKFQGTGVFSGIKMERNPPSPAPPPTVAAETESKPNNGHEGESSGASTTK
jgi:hypothetical protein